MKTIDDVKKFFTENKDSEEVKGFVNELRKDGLIDFLKSDEGYKIAKPFIDSKITQAIGTFEKETLPKKLQAELESKLPDFEKEFKIKYKVKDPEDPTVLDLKKKIEAMEAEAKNAKAEAAKFAKINAVKAVTAKLGLDGYEELFLDEDIEKSIAKANSFSEKFENIVKSKVEAVVGEGKYSPTNPKQKQVTREISEADIDKMSPAEYETFRKENLGLK